MSDVFFTGCLDFEPEYHDDGDLKTLSFMIIENRDKSTKGSNQVINMPDKIPNTYSASLFGERAMMWKGVFKKGMNVIVKGSLSPSLGQSRCLILMIEHIGIVPFKVSEVIMNDVNP